MEMTREKMAGMTEAERLALADAMAAKKAAEWKEREDSFQRCDTDGFLSQWASGLSAQLAEEQESILRSGGKRTFYALGDLDGNELPDYREIGYYDKFKFQYGRKWLVKHADGTTDFVPQSFTSRSKWWKKYRIITVQDWAWAEIEGRGTGFSGTCWIAVKRLKANGRG